MTTTMMKTVSEMSDEQIEALSEEAMRVGDLEQVALCTEALAGDTAARIRCERVIRDAAALAAEVE